MRKPSALLAKATSYRLVALATDLGYIVKVNNAHLHGVADDEAALIDVQLTMDRGDGDRYHDYWMLLNIKPGGTVSYVVGRSTQLFATGEKLEAAQDMEKELRNHSFLNSTRYSGHNDYLPAW